MSPLVALRGGGKAELGGNGGRVMDPLSLMLPPSRLLALLASFPLAVWKLVGGVGLSSCIVKEDFLVPVFFIVSLLLGEKVRREGSRFSLRQCRYKFYAKLRETCQ